MDNLHAAVPAVDVEFKRKVLRLQEFGEGRGQDLERHPTRLAAANLEQGLALRGAGALVEQQAAGAVAFVDRFRPMGRKRDAQAVQLHTAVMAAGELPGAQALA